ncbi:MAG: hypothetical protein LAP39_28775 [Acidobacteriia bacterium]|nr:hypothetical protein [Terriglobia bacterium]
MHTQLNGSAERARSILDAWKRRDLKGLRAELDLAHDHCAHVPGHSFEEQERLDLLDGIAQQLQQGLPFLPLTSDPGGRPEVCYRLLIHLALSGDRPAIRSKKLAVFPC